MLLQPEERKKLQTHFVEPKAHLLCLFLFLLPDVQINGLTGNGSKRALWKVTLF